MARSHSTPADARSRRGRLRLQFRLRTALLMVAYVGLLLSVIATWRATWRYEATALLRVPLSVPSKNLFRPDYTLDAAESLRRAMLVEALTSEAVMERAADRLEREGFTGFAGAESKAGWLAEHVRSGGPWIGEVFVVRFAGPDPQTAVRLVNAVVDAYFEVISEMARAHPDALVERLRRHLDPAMCLDFEKRFREDPAWIIGPEVVTVVARAGVIRGVSNDTILLVGIPLWLMLGHVWFARAGLARRRRRRLASDGAFPPPVV